ncbi:MAG: sugar phosphate nucleotidyltransferase [bacterium]|nr:sugar phosphate nucleotidyltransferase [bacterium]
MKGVILAGGTGSRLFPLTKVTNKHLLPVGRKPMVLHCVDKLVGAGIKNIMIVTGVEHMGDVVSLLGSGKDYNCQFTYRVQDEAGGIAQALGLARDFVGGKKMIVILGDNMFENDLKEQVSSFAKQESGARLLLSEVEDPERFGVATLENGKITKIVEKPSKPETNMAVTGIYMYDSAAFSFIDKCNPSQRGEVEITDVNNFYVSAGKCNYDILPGWWTDAGTFESLARANQLVNQTD